MNYLENRFQDPVKIFKENQRANIQEYSCAIKDSFETGILMVFFHHARNPIIDQDEQIGK